MTSTSIMKTYRCSSHQVIRKTEDLIVIRKGSTHQEWRKNSVVFWKVTWNSPQWSKYRTTPMA